MREFALEAVAIVAYIARATTSISSSPIAPSADAEAGAGWVVLDDHRVYVPT